MVAKLVLNQAAKYVGKKLGKSPFDGLPNPHEIYIENIVGEFDIDYDKAARLFFSDEKMWKDYYTGKRVSGFHPSWERTYGETRPPVLTPEQKEFLDDLTKEDAYRELKMFEFDRKSRSNPFNNQTPDLKQQSQLLENDPLRARQMIVAAGRDPNLFGFA